MNKYKHTYEEIRRMNKILIIVMVVATLAQALFAIFLISGDGREKAYYIVGFLILFCMTVIFMHVKKIGIYKFRYIMILGTASINVIYVIMFHDLNGIITAYLCIAIISIYQEAKLVLIEALICIGSITYGFLSPNSQKMFGEFNNISGYVNILLTLSLCTFFVANQCSNSTNVKKQIIKEKEDTENTNNQFKNLIDILKNSISVLSMVGIELDQNVNYTSDVSQEVKRTFEELESKAMNQVSLLDDMNREVVVQNDQIQNAANEATSMKNLIDSMIKISNISAQKINEMVQHIKEVSNRTGEAQIFINELKDYSYNIESVLEAVDGISEQINLLALNASIEAARAGEHGKGFGVVAQEIGNLADQSKRATVEISDILSKIYDKVEQTSVQVNDIGQKVKASNDSTMAVDEVFKNIATQFETINKSAVTVNSMTNDSEERSNEFIKNINHYGEILKETSKTIGSVMEHIEGQNTSINNIVKNNSELKTLITKLESSI